MSNGVDVIVGAVVMVDLLKAVTFLEPLRKDLGKDISSRGKSKCKGPEQGHF